MVSATSVRQVIEILGSRTITDYKRDLIKCSNLDKKLKEKDFDISSSGARSLLKVFQNTEMIQS